MNFKVVENQCVHLNSINDTVFWGNNSTNDAIIVQPAMWPPFVIYEEESKAAGNSSILYYKYCGPMIVLLKYFAKYINVK